MTIIDFSLSSFHRTQVHVVITDENDNAPRFLKSAYQVTVDEGAILKNIVQVEAVDDDCSPAYSTVCGYEITTPDVPFTIDTEGKTILSLFLTAELLKVIHSANLKRVEL